MPPAICLVVQNVYDGDPRLRRKAEALVAAGYSVDVLALRPAGGRKQYVLNGVTVRTLALGKQRGSLARYLLEYALFFVWVLVTTPWLMRRRHYVVIDVNTLPDFLIFAPIVAGLMGAKLILDLHEIMPEFYISKYQIAERSPIVRLLKVLERVSIWFADHVLTVTAPAEDLFVARGLPRWKSTVVMNAVDETRFGAPPSAVSAIRRATTTCVMMYHGTLTRGYGLDIAIEAFALVERELPGAELWILGSGPEQPALRALAEARGIASSVRILGQVDASEIPSWLKLADVGLLPIRHDVFFDFAFPNKLPEFIAAGLPVIVSCLPAIRRYFSDDALLYAEPDDPLDLARQMVRLYSQPQLRARLVRQAREEYRPIRWEVMKQRYLAVVRELSASGMTRRPEIEPAVAATAQQLLEYCRSHDWSGDDPYDALNSRVFQTLRPLHFRVARIGFTQVVKRSPINLRRVLRISPTQNPKALALVLSALVKDHTLGAEQNDGLVASLVERLAALRSTDTAYWSWGYSFPWQTRTVLLPRHAPNLVCTTFVGGALLDAHERRGEVRTLAMAVSAADYLLSELYCSDDASKEAGFSYPEPSSSTGRPRPAIHNANFLGASYLSRVYKHTGAPRFLGPALVVARSSASRQRSDGSWPYGESSSQQWVDSFHTGYNLCSLRSIAEDAGTDEFDECLGRGFDFYRARFIRQDGSVGYFHDRPYPIDTHAVAQAIITLVTLKDLDSTNLSMANTIARWAIKHLWDERGFFYYRRTRLRTIRSPYLRWSQAWMLLALASLHRESPLTDAPSLRTLELGAEVFA